MTEGFGLPVVEGLLHGSRVVCSDISALREVGGDFCHYFDLYAKDSLSAFAKTICDALAKPAEPARKLEKFSLETVANNLAKIYIQLQKKTPNMAAR